jgi:hypothetical protein
MFNINILMIINLLYNLNINNSLLDTILVFKFDNTTIYYNIKANINLVLLICRYRCIFNLKLGCATIIYSKKIS